MAEDSALRRMIDWQRLAKENPIRIVLVESDGQIG
jgi:hypothetical protein